MIISLHLPKTAGSSFLSSLSTHYGNSLFEDYNDLPLHTPYHKRNTHAILEGIKNRFKSYQDIECIHGHFLPLKYRFINNQNTKYVTLMRDPAERLASQYFYMKRHYTPEKAKKQSLLKTMIDDNWSLERFCLGKELRNTYSKFLWGFPLDNFNFIGIVEYYQADFMAFSKQYFAERLTPQHNNINPNISGKSYFKDSAKKEAVLKHHEEDFLLYSKALQMRNKRISEPVNSGYRY